ncbi:hypothetical protein L1987_28417 [Smallanthus sonchifolius]|uniref:Uncharacterized protein n=1 Tax=Smallanthus sonchifolius TaxID=185202 RepID=A0ACB9HYB5_9ASTR|nr:hypothetical protein L1987_28417 [Smallanthus sonchifolius]
MAEEFHADRGSWWSSPRASCWQKDFMKMKTRSTDESSDCCILPDSAFRIMGPSPSTTTNWYQALLMSNGSRTGEISYNQTLPEILNNLPDGGQNSSNFGMDQEHTSYGYSPSSLLQSLFDGASPPPPPAAAPPQQPLYDFQVNLNDFDPVSSMPGFSTEFNRFFDIKVTKKSSKRETRGSSHCDATISFAFRKASVLHEAIEYIKLLHDQVNVLSKPYMNTMQVQQINNKVNDYKEEVKQQDLRNRGLCLVALSLLLLMKPHRIIGHQVSGTFN